MWRRKLCVTASSRTMLAFENNAHVLLLRFIAGNVDVNKLVSKRSELIGNAEIVRKRLKIHDKSTCVCLRLPVSCRDYAETQGSKLRPIGLYREIAIAIQKETGDSNGGNV